MDSFDTQIVIVLFFALQLLFNIVVFTHMNRTKNIIPIFQSIITEQQDHIRTLHARVQQLEIHLGTP